MTFHFAADNPDLVAFVALIRGERGYPDVGVATDNATKRPIFLGWDDETGWNEIALHADGRRQRDAIVSAIAQD